MAWFFLMPHAARTRDHTPGNWVEISTPSCAAHPIITDLGIVEESDGVTLIYKAIPDGKRKQAPANYCTTVPSPSDITKATAELRREWSAARREWSRVQNNPEARTWEY